MGSRKGKEGREARGYASEDSDENKGSKQSGAHL